MRTIAIINQKGGCGKTTTAINLAGIFARRGMRTLLVDMDPQSHCAAGLAIPEQRIDLDIGDAMLLGPAGLDTSRLLWRASRNLDLAPSRMKLAGLEAAGGGLAGLPDRDRKLGALLGALSPGYDMCLIDCSPSIGLLTYNALVAADEVLIPVETSFFSLQGAGKQVSTIKSVGRRLGATPGYWLVPTIHETGGALASDLLDELRRRFGRKVSPVIVRRDPTLKEAASFGQPVVEYAPDSDGARDYAALADWLLGAAPTVAADEREEGATPAGSLAPEFPDPKPAAAVPPTDAGATSQTVQALTETRPELTPSRAQDVAQRARLLLLRRADDDLKRVLGSAHEGDPIVETKPAGPDSPDSARVLYGARQTRSGVLFVQPLSAGLRASIAGDFNGWSDTAHAMRPNENAGVFQLCVPLEPGRRRYRVVIDGRWSTDPYNPHSEPNPFGELNSIVVVVAREAQETTA